MRLAGKAARKSWNDPGFWLAMLAAPLCWALMVVVGVAQRADPIVWTSFIIIAMVSPVLEEIVFRGGLQSLLLERPVLARSVAGISLANVMTSLVFCCDAPAESATVLGGTGVPAITGVRLGA